jgi:hypothetical protein
MIRSPFEGREAARELFGVLFDVFGDFEITKRFAEGDSGSYFWRARLGDRTIEGVDLVKLDDAGKIAEIRVMIRTLVGIATFASAVGPQLAGRHGRLRAVIARLMTLPLAAFLTFADLSSTRLLQGRRK